MEGDILIMSLREKEPKELNMEEVFFNCEYVIPIYQRNYAWKKIEIEQLLDDIYDSKGKYYLGNLIVDEIRENVFTVIDGQQRLTTLFLLFSYLSHLNFSIKQKLSFEAREKSNRTLNEIKEIKDAKDGYYSEEIFSGYKIIEKYFESRKTIENFKSDFIKKLKDVFLVRILVPKGIDLNHYFEIMNTRGEQLEAQDIVKERILSVIGNDKNRNIASIIWNACSQMDTYVQMNFDVENRKNIFGSNWDSFSYNTFDDLSLKIAESSEKDSWLSLKMRIDRKEKEVVPNDKEDEENERFSSIVSFKNFLLIVNETIKKNESDESLDDKKLLDTLEKHWSSDEKALTFVFNLLKYRFLFDRFIIKREFIGEYSEDGKWSLKKLNSYSYKGKYTPVYKLTFANDESDSEVNTDSLKTLQALLRITYTAPKTMHWISKVLIACDEKADLIKILERYVCKKVKANYKDAKGFEIERIVFTFLDYLLLRDKKLDDCNIQNFIVQFRNSIEHFYPQHPSDDKEKWGSDVLNSFGNLALITVSGNSKFSNLDPMAKVINSPSIIEQSPKLMLMRKMLKENGEKWNKELVERHNNEMLEILEEEIFKYNV